MRRASRPMSIGMTCSSRYATTASSRPLSVASPRPVKPSSVVILRVTKLRPGLQTMTLASTIFMGAGRLESRRASGASRGDSGMNLKRSIPPPAQRAEVSPIQREDVAGAGVLRQNDQRGIGVVEVGIAIFAHDCLGALERLERSWDQDRSAIQDETEGQRGAVEAAEKMRGLRDDGLRRQDRPRPSPEERGARLVVGLAAIEQAHERAGVEQKLTCHDEATAGRTAESSPRVQVGAFRALR